ncbi:L-type lectin-domain containing receptor kinase IX.1-like [Arachis stenosperma]|uniref:L-type lectin-domain containing receptor kinase IX.1-like n=1 Tax=Arachis stenosperma TaxID=217475 RepID=UPI0025ABE78A|nr:L-type lectin-domain containing receptor kinase IX.1-like [Arachis stenosperma]
MASLSSSHQFFNNLVPSILHLLLLITLSSLPILVHPLSFNITNFDDPASASQMAYEGDARSSNGSIDLNKVIYDFRVGRAIYGQPLHLWDSATKALTSFSTSFTFTIDAVNDTKIGDGFVFYLAPLGYQIPPNSAGGTFALFNQTTNLVNQPQNHVVAVEFDTFIGSIDPPFQHVGIDDNSLTSLATAKFDVDKNLGVKCFALISYEASTKTLTVSWSFSGSSGNKTIATASTSNSLSYNIDLMQALPEWVNIGFSSSTGLSTERNVIYSWQFHSTLGGEMGKVQNKKLNIVVVVVPVVVTVVLLTVVVVVGLLIIKKRRRTNEEGGGEYPGQFPIEFDLDRATIPRRFDYKELVAATNGFAEDKRLGQGGSGEVYKGVLSYLGRVVAVKRIFADFENSERVFHNEVRIISRLIHKNLVQFIGWCHEEGELLLVFEFMPNGSLDTHLFGNKKTLAWNLRYKAAIGVATALHYLHEDAEQCVLHRDIKSANVLLDNDFNTKLGDFGMAKLVDPRLRTQRTGVVGTYGYLAPEYINGGRASKESDMYSFGVVALEIASGRRTFRDGEFHVPITNWIWQLYVDGNLMSGADERLCKDFNVNEMMSLLTVGLWCTHPDVKQRPKAAQVIKVLQLEAPLPEIPKDIRYNNVVLPQHSNIVQQPPHHSLESPPDITTSLVYGGR